MSRRSPAYCVQHSWRRAFDVRTANDPVEGLEVFRDWQPDLVITDLMMPGMSGVEVCRAVRAKGSTPVLVLSVRDHERAKVEALDAGADDYVTKPFSTQELLARVRAHLRRAPERTTAAIEAGDFTVDTESHQSSPCRASRSTLRRRSSTCCRIWPAMPAK